MRILVVEDEEIIALAAADALTEAGHIVIGPCRSLETALRIAADRSPDLAVVDIDLCGKNDGLEIAHRLKTELGIDAVFASGQAQLARQHQSDVLGIIHKPYPPEALQGAILVLAAVMAGETPPPPNIPGALELFN